MKQFLRFFLISLMLSALPISVFAGNEWHQVGPSIADESNLIFSNIVDSNSGWQIGVSYASFLEGEVAGISPTAGTQTMHFNNLGEADDAGNSIAAGDLKLKIGLYRLSIDIGNYNNAPFMEIDNLGLTANGALLPASSVNQPIPPSGGIETWTLDYTISEGNINIGKQLGFKVSAPYTGSDRNGSVDNLRFYYQALPSDNDGDGVSDGEDAFPDDPSASVDTDRDGLPDYWNHRYDASDSTSSPRLILDTDDDNDTVSDNEDAYPYDGQRTKLEGYEHTLCKGSYCSLNGAVPVAGETHYFYKIGTEEEEYEFHFFDGDLNFEYSYGATAVSFQFFDGNVFQDFDTDNGDAFAQALRDSRGKIRLRQAESYVGGWKAIQLSSSLSVEKILLVVAGRGQSPSSVVGLEQKARQVVLNPPLTGTGTSNSQECTRFKLDPAFAGSNVGADAFYLTPSRSIPQGRHGVENGIFVVSGGVYSGLTICSDTPEGNYDLTYQVLDGLGGKLTFPLSVSISEEKIDGGKALWRDPVSSASDCENFYCLEAFSGQQFLTFTLTKALTSFPFERPMESPGRGSGSSIAFQLETDQGLADIDIVFNGTEEQRETFGVELNGSPYHLWRAAALGNNTNRWLAFSQQGSVPGDIVFYIRDDNGARVENIRQMNSYLRVTPPTEGTGSWSGSNKDECVQFGSLFNGQDGFVLPALGEGYFSILETTIPMSKHVNPFGAPYDHGIYFCEDSPSGIFETTLAFTDGRGGKISLPLTIEVLDEKIDGGAVEWFRNKSTSDKLHTDPDARSLSRNLVAYYPLNGNAHDLSGNANHALQSQSGVPDRFGNANGSIELSGASNLETLYSPTQHLANQFSIGVWIRAEQCASNGQAVILAKTSRLDSVRGEGRGNDEFQFNLVERDGECFVEVATASGPRDLTWGRAEATIAEMSMPFESEVWMHVMVVVAPARAVFYKNGMIIGEVGLDFAIPQAPDEVPMRIGSGLGDSGPARHQFSGQMDDLIVFARALTPSEVQVIYAGNTVDSDADGVPDWLDNFPSNAAEQFDSDADGVGNKEDSDDDGDGVFDTRDFYYWDPERTVPDAAVCENGFCVETAQEYDQEILAYHYALSNIVEPFAFELKGREPIENFLAATNDSAFGFGDSPVVVDKSSFDANDLSLFKQYLAGANSEILLSSQTGVFFDMGGPAPNGQSAGSMQMYLRNFDGQAITDYPQENFHLRLVRPQSGLYVAENIGEDCASFDARSVARLPGTNQGISLFSVHDQAIPDAAYGAADLNTGKSIVPSQRLQYRPRSGGTGVRVCSSTPPGIYSDTFIALDGRGGSEAYHYTVEVAIEKTETGSAAWFPAQAEAPSDQLVFDQLNLGLAAHLTLDGTRINSAPVENFDVTYSANFDGSTTFVQGPLGQGVTGQVVIPSGNVPNQLREGAYSIAYWARLGPEASCGGSSQQSVLLQYGDASGGIVFQADCIQNNGGLDYTGSVVGLNQAQLPSDYQWHHYTLTVDDDNNAKLYIDGVKGSEGVAPARTISENNNLILGSATGDCDCAFDDFRIYERSLGSVDVYNLYRLGSGSAEVGLQPEVIGTCSSNYCSENANSIFYVYRLTDELEPFIFDPLHKREPIQSSGGLVGGSFNYSADLKPFKTTDSQLDSQEADFTDYLMASTGNLLLKGGDPLGNSLRSQNANGEKFLEFHLTNWSGALIKPEMTQASFGAVITRPEVSDGIYGGNCQRFLADQVFTGLVPSGGAIMMTFNYGDVSVAHPPNSTDATSFVVCDDTTPGVYPMVLEALDGRGGKLKADFTLSVTNTNEGSGSIVWNTSTGDRDNDGVPDDIDAFPNDPAASVDTDGDGLPDRWNIGYFAEDSTSTPALIKDMDDDGDGVLDNVDQRPLDASETLDFDGDGIGDNADTDDDDDGYNDAEDAFSLNPFDWTDTDNDGVGDNTDAFGLDENQQSLLVAEAVSKVLDETLRKCIAAATVDLSRAQDLTELGCGYDGSMPPVLDLSGLEHFFNLEVINLGRAAPVSLEPLSNLNNLSELHINNVFWPIRDLSPLGQLYRLRSIRFDRDETLTDGDFEALSRLRNLDEITFGFNNELSSIEFLRNHPRLKRVLIGYAKISDFSRIADLEFLQVLGIYEQGTQLPLDVSFLRANRELLTFGTHMGIAGERVFLYLNKLKVFSTGWSGSPDQPHQFSEYTNLDFLMNAVELERISVENYGLSDFSRLSSFPNLKSINIKGNRISDLSVLTGLDQLASVSLVSNGLQALGDVLINWPALSNGNTFFNLSNNPLPCSVVEAARANPNITVEFDGQCAVQGIDAFKFDAPTRPYAVYHYALDSAPFTYPYELNGDQYSVSDRGGWTGMTFSVEFNDQMQLFASPFDTEALNSAWQSGGGSTVMATEATGNRDTRKFRVSGGVKEAQIAIFTNFGLSAEDVVQTGHYLRVTRPTVGSAPWGDGADCAFPTLEGFSPQIEREKQIGLYFSDLIEGGSAPMFEHSLGENALLNCSDTPPGIYDLQVAALDGRGGKKLFNLTVEVLAEQTAGGKLEWLSKPSDGFLPCNDYCVQTADRLAYRFALSEASTASGRTIVYGVEDFFETSNGSEAAPISDGLQAHLGDAALADLDDVSTNKSRAFSFDLSSLRGLITGAVLKIRARPLDDERAEGNDGIYLSGFDESGNNLMPAYTIGLGVDSPPNNYFDFDWQIDGRPAHPAEGYEIVINLASFAAKEGTGLSLIEAINTTRLLDMVVGDDTNVDYVSLEVSTGSAEAERFPFYQSMENVEAEFRGGWVGGAFEFKLNDEFKAFATTDNDGNYQSGDYFAQQSALFTTAIREGAGGISLRLTESGGVDNSFGLNNLEKETTLGLTTNGGNSVEQISVRNRYVRMTRLEPGSGSRADSQCTEYGIDEYADGIQHHGQSSLMPNNVISGGTMDLLGFGGENSFYLCSDTPVGIFPVVFQVLDGRGGKTQIELTIEVLGARTPQGKVEWFAYSPNAVDSDGDGVPDNIDAFPYDPAASVDTDGDGMPDRWNPGYFAEDSTSTPALIKDMDDDGDGVLDSVDQRPLDASEIYDFDGDGIGDNADSDDDDDGYSDVEDAFPFNPFDWTDADSDGVGDNTDAFGLNASEQSLPISEALAQVTDEALRSCLILATENLARAHELTDLGCSPADFDAEPAVLSLEGLQHFYNLETITFNKGAPGSLEPLRRMNALRKFSTGNYEWRITDLSPLSQLYRLRVLQWDNDLALTAFDFEALSRLSNIREFGFGFNNELSSLAFLRNHPRLQSILLGYANVTDFDPVGELEFLKNVSIYNQSHGQSIDVSFLRGNRELQSFGTHMGIAGERVFLYLNKLKVFSTGWSGSPDQPFQLSEYTNLDFLMNAVELEQISVENYGLSDFLRLSSFPKLKSLNINGNRISDLSVLTGLDQLESVSLVSNELQALGDVLINWPALSNGNTFFNLSNNPLPCSVVEAARANPNITVEFDGQCGLLGIDAFKFDAPARPYAVYHYALDSASFTYPYELNGDQYSVSDRGGWTGMTFSVEFNDQMQLFASPFDTEALNSAWQSGGGSTVMATEATGNRDTRKFSVSGGAKEAQIAIFTNFGLSAEDVVQTGHYLRVTRPTVGSAPWGDGADCAFPTLEGFSPQIEREKQIGLYFSDLIEGGSAPMFEHSLGENALLNCSDTPSGIYDLQVAALDGRGGKKLFDLTVEVLEAQTPGGKLEWVAAPPEVIGTCSSNYCSESANSIFYVYRLTDELEPFIFDPLHKREPIKYSGGLVGGSFNCSTDLKSFKTTDSQLESQEADFTDYLMASTGNLLLKGGDPLGNSLRSENANGEKFLEFHLTNWSGALIKPEMTQASFGAVITRPEVSAGIYGGNCQRFLADQVFTGLVPSGWAIMMTFDYGDVSVAHPPNSADATSFVVCDDTTPGEYPMVLEALDGRGGKLKADFTLSVTNTNEGSGSIVWSDDSNPDALFYEPFDTDTATFETTFSTYDRLESIRPGPVRVVDDRLEIIPTGVRDANLAYAVTIKRQFSGDLEMTAQIGGEGEALGSFMVGVSVGNNVLLFHPGLDGGQFRHEIYDNPTFPGVIDRPPNLDMGFKPAQQVLHFWQVTVDGETGFVRVTISQGDDPTNQYYYEFTDTRLLQAYTLGLIGDGNVGAGYGYIDSVSVYGTYADSSEGDSDRDGVPDNFDAFPFDPAASVDTDGDGMPNDWNPGQSASDSTSQPPLELDYDDDNDSYDDSVDVFPLDPSEWADCESDGIGDNADTDDDNDGIPDTGDAYPCNPEYSFDSDGDGMPDAWEARYGLDPSKRQDAYLDPDQDGYLNWEEFQMGLDPSVSDREAQLIYVQAAAYIVPGSSARLTVNYSTTDTNPNLSGLGIRVHYDARYVSSVELTNIFSESFISVSAPQEDVNDFDGDPQTDRYILVSWASIQGPIWPGSLPAELFDIEIESVEDISCLPYYPIRFSVSAAATGYNVSAPSVYNPVMQATLDVDGDGEAAALTDGLLIIRRLFGFSGSTLINGSVAQSAEYQSAPAIADRIDGFNGAFDIDADGKTEALTDGLLIIRRLFGFSGTTLVAGSVASDGARTDATAIARYIDALSSADTNGGSCPSLPDGMIDSNDGTYLTDLNSGLDWRDVNLTLGLSFNEVSTKILSGDLSGWRFATIPEINTLISNFSGIEFDVTTYGGIELENNEIDELITLLGPTSIQGSERIVWGFHSTGPYGNSTRSAWLRDVGVEGLTDTTVANNGLTDKSVGLADHGSFLVRETQL